MLSSIHPVATSGRFTSLEHDARGQRLATSSFDGAVYVWQTSGLEEPVPNQTSLQHIAVMKGHDGPVWTVAFAPAECGNICATGGFDRKVIVWNEVAPNDWKIVFWDDNTHKAGITSLSFCMSPAYANGLHLAVASLDGSVTVFSLTNEGWISKSFLAHMGGVRRLAWAPPQAPISNDTRQNSSGSATSIRRLATCGIDCRVCIWELDPNGSQDWNRSATLHLKRALRCLEWQPACEIPRDLIAVLADDGSVSLWELVDRSQPNEWKEVGTFPQLAPGALKLSWSLDGLLLAVPVEGPQHVRIIRENSERQWELHNVD